MKNSALSFYAYCHRRHFIHILARKFWYAYDTKVILILSEEKFKGKIAYVEEQKEGNIPIVNGSGAVDSEDRKRPATTPRNVLE